MMTRLYVFVDSPGYGGSELNLIRFLGFISPLVSTTVVLAEPDSRLLTGVSALPIKRLQIPSCSNRIWGSIKALYQVYRLAKSEDLIRQNCLLVFWAHHLDSSRWTRTFFGLFGGRVAVVEQLMPSSMEELRSSRLTLPLKRLFNLLGNETVVNGSFQLPVMVDLLGFKPTKLSSIPNSRNVPDIGRRVQAARSRRSQTLLELGIPGDSIVVLSVCRLSAEKNLSSVIRVIKSVMVDHPRLRFVAVGDGEMRVVLQEEARHGGRGEKFLFTGFHEDVSVFYGIADLFILFSRREGLSGALIEAMSAGVPCIVSDIPANRELIQDGEFGWVVDTASDDALSLAVRECLRNPELGRKRAYAARQKAALMFSEDKEAERWRAYVNVDVRPCQVL